ncbi:hypothetical protein EYZ11_003299 [Aspergillus tanneri]|uniref:Uncharacterized protein n=1 Tax=Aspergillus tanneri TaxID=1220188 RepID=A0A4S3JNM8_9EURO|nr:hypothetical protein EYZ11_003299 [Aspergillus tanneri]
MWVSWNGGASIGWDKRCTESNIMALGVVVYGEIRGMSLTPDNDGNVLLWRVYVPG